MLQAQRELAPATWLGARALVRWEELTEVETGGQLAPAELPGCSGGTVVVFGVAATRDRRDRVIAPRSGTLVEAMWAGFTPALGSAHRFGLLELDSRAYIPTGRAYWPSALGAGRPTATHRTPCSPCWRGVLTDRGDDRLMGGG